MSKHAFAWVLAAVLAFATTAEAQRVRGGFENAAGGVTAGAAQDVRGHFGGRAVGEGGVVTDGDGSGVAGSRGCARSGAGGRGCGARATRWDEDGNVHHDQSAYAQGAFGNTASTQGSFDRDENGDLSGSRSGEVNVGDRTYSADTSFDSDNGWDRDVNAADRAVPIEESAPVSLRARASTLDRVRHRQCRGSDQHMDDVSLWPHKASHIQGA